MGGGGSAHVDHGQMLIWPLMRDSKANKVTKFLFRLALLRHLDLSAVAFSGARVGIVGGSCRTVGHDRLYIVRMWDKV
jgi:hypothetical protein